MIENLVVSESQRGKGAGAALTTYLIEYLQKRECLAIFVDVDPDNSGAIQFYRRFGLDSEVMLLERHLFEES